MYIKNKWVSIIWKILLLVICAYGLSYHMRAGRWSSFNYYTVLSNAVCFVYFFIAVIENIRSRAGGIQAGTWQPSIEKAVVFCITVTFLIYNFILRPEMFKMGNGGNFYTVLNMVEHYIVPIMVILDWLFFASKGGLRRWEPLLWLVIPALYLAYILLRAPIAGNIVGTNSPYPYNFINVQIHGASGVAANSVMLEIGLLIVAYVIYFIDLGLAVLGKRMLKK